MSPLAETPEPPTYAEISWIRTSYVEVVHILYNSQKVTYESLIQHFFTFHDPSALDGQRTDVRNQYKSIIFTHSEKQQEIAEEVIK